MASGYLFKTFKVILAKIFVLLILVAIICNTLLKFFELLCDEITLEEELRL